MKQIDFDRILGSVPPDYYQKGIHNNLLQKYWHSTKINFAKKILDRIEFKNCLEVGCASGYLISEIAKNFSGVKFYGIDPYGQAIKLAQNKYPQINFLQTEAEKMPFKNNQFDLLLCYETIEHIRDPKKALLEMKRVLKKGGKLVLAMDSGNLAFRVVWFFWEKSYGKVWREAHLNPYHFSELEKLVRESGFKIKNRYFTHFGLEVVLVLEK